MGGSLHDEAIIQASLGVQLGGLGLRHASENALPAYISSKISAKPIVARLAAGLQNVDMLPESFESDFTNSLSAAITTFKAGLEPGSAETVDELIGKEAIFVEQLLKAAETGQTLPSRGSGGNLGICDLFAPPAGSEDPERNGGSSLQSLLSKIADKTKSQKLRQHFVNIEAWEDVWRLDELKDESVSHEWLWMLHPGHGDLVPADFSIQTSRLIIINVTNNSTCDGTLNPSLD